MVGRCFGATAWRKPIIERQTSTMHSRSRRHSQLQCRRLLHYAISWISVNRLVHGTGGVSDIWCRRSVATARAMWRGSLTRPQSPGVSARSQRSASMQIVRQGRRSIQNLSRHVAVIPIGTWKSSFTAPTTPISAQSSAMASILPSEARRTGKRLDQASTLLATCSVRSGTPIPSPSTTPQMSQGR